MPRLPPGTKAPKGLAAHFESVLGCELASLLKLRLRHLHRLSGKTEKLLPSLRDWNHRDGGVRERASNDPKIHFQSRPVGGRCGVSP